MICGAGDQGPRIVNSQDMQAMRSLPTVVVSIAALAFVAWATVLGLSAKGLFASAPAEAPPCSEAAWRCGAAGG